MPRREPYTERGIGRVPCMRCGEPSSQQWQVCAMDNLFHGVCTACDIKLNRLVLKFFGIPGQPLLIAAYRAHLRQGW